jgi:hypothetical protein
MLFCNYVWEILALNNNYWQFTMRRVNKSWCRSLGKWVFFIFISKLVIFSNLIGWLNWLYVTCDIIGYIPNLTMHLKVWYFHNLTHIIFHIFLNFDNIFCIVIVWWYFQSLKIISNLDMYLIRSIDIFQIWWYISKFNDIFKARYILNLDISDIPSI